jgi:hypothetical protein
MKPAAMIRRDIASRKPPHGAACNRCGVCCLVTLCEIGRAVYGRDRGPCPALRWDGPDSACKLTELGPPNLNAAALVLVRAGEGCDCRINGEAVNTAFHDWQDRRDKEQAGEIKSARKLWGLT